MLGDDPDHEGGGELHDDGARRILHAARGQWHDALASRSPASRLPTSPSAIVGATLAPCQRASSDGADRDPVDQQRAGVVEQALAFEDLQQAIRQLDLAAGSRSRPRHPAARRWRRARSRPAQGMSGISQCATSATADRGQADRGNDQGCDRNASCRADRAARCRRRHRAGRVRQKAPTRGPAPASRTGSFGTKAISAPPMARNVG